MNISSTPFIRNDYWPDYNDINQLNQRINEVENELSLTNIRLSTDIENVSNNLNSYADNQANTTIANNIIVNNINANYAVGKFVNFGSANLNNAYVENLTVNKPVFDITLNTPHIENVTSLGGNIYDANLFNVNITGGDVAFNNVSVNDLNAANATISNVNILDGDVNLNKAVISDLNTSNATVLNLFVNTQPEPVTSSAVLGYDSDGRVIPVHASFDVGFPEDANYVYTDHAGTAFAGVAATEVSAVNNLITAQAVQNGFNNLAEEEQIDMNNIVSHILPYVVVNFFNSKSPLNYQSITDVNYNAGSFISPYYLGNNVYMRLNGTTLEFSLPATVSSLFYTGTSNMYITNNNSMAEAFYNCKSLNQNIQIPSSVTNMVRAFTSCSNLNQNIQIPSSVTDIRSVFIDCKSLNQNILIPSSVTDMGSVFQRCSNLNQNIQIPSSVTSMFSTFFGCSILNQNILIPSGVTDMVGTFRDCSILNQNILIPSGVTKMPSTFMNCASLNQNILIPNTVDTLGIKQSKTAPVGIFAYCVSLNKPIAIPNSVNNMQYTFNGCTGLNQDDMYIYSQNITNMTDAYNGVQYIGNIHIPTSVPKDTSNFMYNCLVNGNTGYTFASENIINDLPVDIAQWPPEA